MTQLALSGVSKAFGAVYALREVSFRVDSGQRVALVGPNGAGKSTLLQILSSAMRPDSGSVVIDRYTTSEQQGCCEFRRQLRFGYLGSESLLYADLTIEENLLLAARLQNLDDPEHAAAEIAERLAITGSLGKFVRECSQGIARRASAARALLHGPELLLLDEPLANLDTDGRQRLLGVLRAAHEQGATILVATHDEELIRGFAQRVIELARGAVARDCTVEEWAVED